MSAAAETGTEKGTVAVAFPNLGGTVERRGSPREKLVSGTNFQVFDFEAGGCARKMVPGTDFAPGTDFGLAR